MSLFIGKNIRQNPPEVLQPITESAIVTLIVDAESALASETTRLRRVSQLDQKAYATAKLSLPYVVGATFEQNCRHTDHFAEINYLVLDFDHCLQTPAQSQQLQQRIALRAEVWLMFVSPSGNGLKVWCRLATPCTNPGIFKAFYREFSSRFADEINLLGTLDTRTCDVTRVCFLSHDPHAYCNQYAQALDWQQWQASKDDGVVITADTELEIKLPTKPPLSPVIYSQLLKKANPRAVVRPKEEPFVPELVQSVQEQLLQQLAQEGIGIEQIVPLPYGLKFVCTQQLKRAEVSIFYGKRGFSIVKTPKGGTDQGLTDKVYTLFFELLF